jgi:CRP/FNR family transcriptional regulator, cyclic AMP receptor protein
LGLRISTAFAHRLVAVAQPVGGAKRGWRVGLSAMKVDPALVKIFAENVRATVLQPAATLRLDAGLVHKISQRVAVFRDMTPVQLADTLALGETFPVKAGDAVFQENDIGESFFVVITGQVVVQKAKGSHAVELARLGSGECFGEMALVDRKLRSASVRAVTDTVTMRFYQQLIDTHPASAQWIYRNIARILANRLEESSVMLADLLPPVP